LLDEEKAEPDARANAARCHDLCWRTARAIERRGSSVTLGKNVRAMNPPEVGLGAALAFAAWTVIAICVGWIALVGGWLKRRFGWRYLPRAECSIRTAIVFSVVALAAMLSLVGLMLWRSQPFPFGSLAEGTAFVCYFAAPTICLVLAIAFARDNHQSHVKNA
jgi:hypothetical protein